MLDDARDPLVTRCTGGCTAEVTAAQHLQRRAAAAAEFSRSAGQAGRLNTAKCASSRCPDKCRSLAAYAGYGWMEWIAARKLQIAMEKRTFDRKAKERKGGPSVYSH